MITQQPKKYKILLIGDNCLDIYQYGTVDRLSPEAPVPVFVPTEKVERDGMAGNVYANLVALGCEVNLLCGHASKKTRLIDSRSKQQILRIDEDVKSTPITIESEFPPIYDAVVISDYNKGVVDYALINDLRKSFNGPIFMDTKKQDIAQFYGIFVKINELEFKNRHSINDSLIVTLGERGAMYKTGRDPKYELMFESPKVEVVDVTGAGDTFLAALAYKWLDTGSINAALFFAIEASSVTVQHFGCYAPTLKEIL